MLAYNTSKYTIIEVKSFFTNEGFETDVNLETRKYKKLVQHTTDKVDRIYFLTRSGPYTVGHSRG